MHFFIEKSVEDCQSFVIHDDEEFPQGEKLVFEDLYAHSFDRGGDDPATQTTTEEQETKTSMACNRCNAFLNRLGSLEKFQELARPVKSVLFLSVHLDDWEPLLRVLQQQGANIENIKFWSCTFTERGAQLLGTILSGNPLIDDNTEETTTTSGSYFSIRDFDISKPEGSTAWIDGFLQNKTITCLSLECTSMLVRAIRFLRQSTQIKKATLKTSEEKGPEAALLKIDHGTCVDYDDDDAMETDGSMNLRYLKLSLPDQELTLNLCLELGSLLRKAKRLEEFRISNAQSDIPHDFLRDAIHCQTLVLQTSNVDPNTLAFLIQGSQDDNNEGAGGGGNLKNLHYNFPQDIEKAKQFLDLVDLSLLDRFEVNCLDLIGDLAYHLAQNKGPKHLKLLVFGDLKDYLLDLIDGFYGNNKIEELEIVANDFSSVSHFQEAFLEVILVEMPKLRSWKMQVHSWDKRPDPNIEQISDSEDEDEENVTMPSTNGPSTKDWNDWIWDRVDSNPNIQEIETSIPIYDGVWTSLQLNKGRKLLRYHDKMSSGIWSHALSRSITGDLENDLFLRFQVVKEIPSLFPQTAKDVTDEQEKEVPRFVMGSPPGGHKRRKVMAMELSSSSKAIED